ncbi:MAG: DUF6427 family protein [Bacteroidota bacterium]
MISSFFSKTKPINYVVLSVSLFLVYWSFQMLLKEEQWTVDGIAVQLGVSVMLIISFFLTNDILKQNKVASSSSYALLFFVLLTVLFPKGILDNNAVLANFFLLLALQRVLALKSIKNVKHKIFDATIWVCFASLFFDWAILFLMVVIFSIITYQGKQFKNWLVPIAGILAFLLLLTTLLFVFDARNVMADHYQLGFKPVLINFFNWRLHIKIDIYLFLVVILILVDFFKYRKKGAGKLIMSRIILLFFIIGVMVNFLESRTASAILLTFFPAAVFMTNYLDAIKKIRLKEALLWMSILFPLVLFLVEYTS